MARQLCKGKGWDGKRWTGKTMVQEHGKRIEQWWEAQRMKEQWRQEEQQQLQKQQQQQRIVFKVFSFFRSLPLLLFLSTDISTTHV